MIELYQTDLPTFSGEHHIRSALEGPRRVEHTSETVCKGASLNDTSPTLGVAAAVLLASFPWSIRARKACIFLSQRNGIRFPVMCSVGLLSSISINTLSTLVELRETLLFCRAALHWFVVPISL